MVALEGESLAQALEGYFTQSQQINMRCKIAVKMLANESAKPKWMAGAMYIEQMPDSGQEREGYWREANILFQTLTDKELLDSDLPLPELIHRLYHERGVWVYEPHDYQFQCRCSREKLEQSLSQMPDQELIELFENNLLSVDCQFCGEVYQFSAQDLKLAGDKPAH